MTQSAALSDVDRTRAERDLFLRLLNLGTHTDPKLFLEDALSLIVEASEAVNGYIEINDLEDRIVWSTSVGFTELEERELHQKVSRGIVAEARATGRTVDTPSAILDPRFSDRASVKGGRIEAVLCVPMGSTSTCGVLYLQGRRFGGPFNAADRERAEIFSQQVARLADHIHLRLKEQTESDPTRAFRESLQVERLIGRSPALASLLEEIHAVRALDVGILLTGDSGTGKSLVARLIHDNSKRASGPFTELNCASLPESLVENELYGAMPGGHSTATRRVLGKVGAAEGGTLFLDEIGELSIAAQAKLLQLLQSKIYYPLGASEPLSANVRMIAATNTDLRAAVAAGTFREDLYYRLDVVSFRIPSLAERRSDIALLARHFCKEACERHHLPRLELSARALNAIEAAEWPGNVRQLANAVERAVIRAAGQAARSVEPFHVFPDLNEPEGQEQSMSFQEQTRRFQANLLLTTLRETGWNVSETARRLDLARSHVYNLIRAFDLQRE